MADIPKGFKLVEETDIPAGFKLAEAPAAPAELPEPTGPSVVESGLRGAGGAASLGFGGKIAGGIEALAFLRPGGSTIESRFREGEREFNEAQQLAQETNPAAFGAGEVLGTLAPLAVAGGPAAGLKLGGRLLRGAKAGGFVGGAREAGAGGDIGDIATGALGGATIGGALPVAGAAGPLLKKGGPLLEKLTLGAATTAGAVSGTPLLAVPAFLAAQAAIKGGKALAGPAGKALAPLARPSGALLTSGALVSGAQPVGGAVQSLIESGAKSAFAKRATPAEKFVASETSEKFRVENMKQSDKDFEKEQRRLERAK